MPSKWSCSECGTNVIEITSLRIYEEGEYKDFCFDCGTNALKQTFQQLSQIWGVMGWHFTIPNLEGKKHVLINYLPEVIKYG